MGPDTSSSEHIHPVHSTHSSRGSCTLSCIASDCQAGTSIDDRARDLSWSGLPAGWHCLTLPHPLPQHSSTQTTHSTFVSSTVPRGQLHDSSVIPVYTLTRLAHRHAPPRPPIHNTPPPPESLPPPPRWPPAWWTLYTRETLLIQETPAHPTYNHPGNSTQREY